MKLVVVVLEILEILSLLLLSKKLPLSHCSVALSPFPWVGSVQGMGGAWCYAGWGWPM